MLTTQEFIDKYCDGDIERYNAILRDGRDEAVTWDELLRSKSEQQNQLK